MTKKAYIVANEKQEREVLEKFERDGIVWVAGIEKPTEWIPSQLEGAFTAGFPYALVIDNKGRVSWSNIRNLTNQKIVYDGRKEEQMSDKYVVSQEFMNELEEWRKNKNLINELVWYTDIKSIPEVVKEWWAEDFVDKTKTNNRLIAIISWVNGEDVLEVEKPNKWVVRSKGRDDDGNYGYVDLIDNAYAAITNIRLSATRFDTKEEAEGWANSHQEVIEVEE